MWHSSLINSSEPVLDTLIQFIQGSPEHRNESVAIFAIAIGLDRFDKNIHQIARETRFTREQLQEIVLSVRRAEQSNAPRVPRQHLVSAVLQREWEAEPNKGVSRYSLHTGLNPGGHSWPPEKIGYLKDFVKVDSQTTEDVWNATEGKIRPVLTAIKNGKLFQDHQHSKTLGAVNRSLQQSWLW